MCSSGVLESDLRKKHKRKRVNGKNRRFENVEYVALRRIDVFFFFF